MADGSTLDVTKPGMAIVGETRAVLTTVWATDDEGRDYAKQWRTVPLADLTRLDDLEQGAQH
jgi:hypothetical protein